MKLENCGHGISRCTALKLKEISPGSLVLLLWGRHKTPRIVPMESTPPPCVCFFFALRLKNWLGCLVLLLKERKHETSEFGHGQQTYNCVELYSEIEENLLHLPPLHVK